VAQTAFEDIAQDQSLQGGLTARGYVPLLEWALDRALPAASCLEPEMEAVKAAGMVAALLRRLLQAAVWAAEASDPQLLIGELASCPPLVVRREVSAAALSRLELSDDADGNAEAIAGALMAATPLELDA